MTTEKGWWSDTPEDHLYLLAWVDCLERIDLLILEARHLQQRVILGLREPVLYLPLAEEEKHLWGNAWAKEFERGKSDAELAADWLPLYPKPMDAVVHYPAQVQSVDQEELSARVESALFDLWHGGYWSREQRRHYHTLRAVQILKRQMLQDKITLCRHALRAQLHRHTGQPHDRWAKPRFMMLRAVIIARVRDYVQRLADHQHAFNKATDSGPQDSPRPTLERRRELGIYAYYLADRTRDLQHHMALLFTEMKVQDAEAPTVLHSWDDVHRSHQAYLEDEVGEVLAEIDAHGHIKEEERRKPQPLHYITTHYWMPERPDLQPVIAHELAHGVIAARLGNLGDPGLAEAEDDFSALLVDLRECLGAFSVSDYPSGVGPVPEGYHTAYLIREIACDLLAASVKGFAYLYAIFLELVGVGLEYACLVNRRRFDPEMVLYIEGGGGDEVRLQRNWYLRLRVLHAWLSEIHHHEKVRLDAVLMEGVLKVLEDLSAYLDYISGPRFRKAGRFWQLLADRLVEIIQESPTCRVVKQFRQRRKEDQYKEDETTIGERRLPHSMKRLDPRVRDFLYRVHGTDHNHSTLLYTGVRNRPSWVSGRDRFSIDKSR